MKLYLIRFFVLLLITSFTLSIAIGCGGRQTKRLQNRINSLEKNMETMNKNMETIKKTMDMVDSLDKKVTTLEQRTYDIQKLTLETDKPETVETEMDSPEKGQ
jgi:predicted  nucleic acid-binding Zn-ribbon protein